MELYMSDNKKKNPFIDFTREQLYALWRFFALLSVALLTVSFTLHSKCINDTAQEWFTITLLFGISNIGFILYHMGWSLLFFYRKLSRNKKTFLCPQHADIKAYFFEWLILVSFTGCFVCFIMYLLKCL